MGINVLSLFDGMSCGQIALERAGIKVDNYYASEIDKWAIKITQKNYPKTIQLGSITEWRKWDIPKPDLIIGGSPCQGFSFAGKGLNFDDPRSKLFFEFAEILRHYKPKCFLLENVIMAAQSNDVISSILGDIYPECVSQHELYRTGRLEPIMINSALVSAQNRERLYWTNIPNITQPEDKGILLKDILEDGETDRHKSLCLDANYHKGGNEKNYKDKSRRQLIIVGNNLSELKVSGFESSNTPISINKPKAYTLRANAGGIPAGIGITDGIQWRKLTPVECERLQTAPDNYTDCVSNSRRYHALGNGWTVDVIAHIFKNLPQEWRN